MSHFSVLVLTREGQDVEGLLLPYMENCCGEPPREYMEFFEDEECEVDEEDRAPRLLAEPQRPLGLVRGRRQVPRHAQGV